MKNEKGFTLIELMVVTLIIGILVAIALPTFLGAKERREEKQQQQVHEITYIYLSDGSVKECENAYQEDGGSWVCQIVGEDGTYDFIGAYPNSRVDHVSKTPGDNFIQSPSPIYGGY